MHNTPLVLFSPARSDEHSSAENSSHPRFVPLLFFVFSRRNPLKFAENQAEIGKIRECRLDMNPKTYMISLPIVS